jgi:hypothetical protein
LASGEIAQLVNANTLSIVRRVKGR